MAGSSDKVWDKILLIAACICILIAGIMLIVDGAKEGPRGLIAYGVAGILIAIGGVIFAFKGKPKVKVDPPPEFSIKEIGGVLDVPWWLWLIDVGLLGIAALLAHTVLA